MEKDVKKITQQLQDDYFWSHSIKKVGYQTLIRDMLRITGGSQMEQQEIKNLRILVYLCFMPLSLLSLIELIKRLL